MQWILKWFPSRLIIQGGTKQDLMKLNNCTAIRIRCSEKRYQQPGVLQLLPEAYESCTFPGGSLWFVSRPGARQEFFDSVRAFWDLGVKIDTVQLVDHFDAEGIHGCRAYDRDDSQHRHEANLREAARLIIAEPDFKHMKIQLMLHDIDSETVQVVPPTPVEKPVAA